MSGPNISEVINTYAAKTAVFDTSENHPDLRCQKPLPKPM